MMRTACAAAGTGGRRIIQNAYGGGRHGRSCTSAPPWPAAGPHFPPWRRRRAPLGRRRGDTTGGYRRLPAVIGGYRRLPAVIGGYRNGLASNFGWAFARSERPGRGPCLAFRVSALNLDERPADTNSGTCPCGHKQRHVAGGVWRMACETERAAYGVWRERQSGRRMAYGVRDRAGGVWRMA
jgi:hypothetical protein